MQFQAKYCITFGESCPKLFCSFKRANRNLSLPGAPAPGPPSHQARPHQPRAGHQHQRVLQGGGAEGGLLRRRSSVGIATRPEPQDRQDEAHPGHSRKGKRRMKETGFCGDSHYYYLAGYAVFVSSCRLR